MKRKQNDLVLPVRLLGLCLLGTLFCGWEMFDRITALEIKTESHDSDLIKYMEVINRQAEVIVTSNREIATLKASQAKVRTVFREIENKELSQKARGWRLFK
jgi:hypothetical protein